MTFQTSDFTTDSDAAYKTAAARSGGLADRTRRTPLSPSASTLGAASRFPAPVWYILFGNAKSGFAVTINASTGNPREITRTPRRIGNMKPPVLALERSSRLIRRA